MFDLDNIISKIRVALFRDQVGLFPGSHDIEGSEDVPFKDLSNMDKAYVTNTQYPFDINEQMGLGAGMPQPTTGVPGSQAPEAGAIGNMGAMPSEMGGGMFGAGVYEKDPETIGRIYELKKIYSRLLAIETFLSTASEEILIKLREYITKAIELFEVLIENVNAFTKDLNKLNHIIVLFYKLLDTIYTILRNYLKEKVRED